MHAPALLERGSALAALDLLADDALGGTGRTVVIEAGAGLGKTALLEHCAARLADRGLRLLGARGAELERNFPYGIVRQLLTPVVRDAQLRSCVLAGAAAGAEVLFAGSAKLDAAPTAGGEPFETAHALYWAFANLCDQGPVAVLVDDAHEADAASRQLLAFLSRRLADLPLLLVVAGRPAPDAMGFDESATALPLQPLSAEAAAAIVAQRIGSVPDADFVAACMHATGGNPFYLQELARAVTDRGLAPSAGSARWVGELGPATIVRRTLFRLASLPSAVPLARAVAILGDGAPMWACARLAGIPLDEAAPVADALCRVGILAPGTRPAFVHPILRAAIIADLGEHSRQRWHVRAAELLDGAGFEPDVVALHLLRTDPSGADHARDILVRAGRAAAREGSPATAARLFRRALAESSAAPSADLQYELGLAEASLGSTDGQQLMAAGIQATPDAGERVRRTLQLANFQMRSGDLPDAVRLLSDVRAGIEDEDLLLHIDATRYWAGRLHPATRDAALSSAAELRCRAEGPDTPARRALLAYLACEAAQTGSAADAVALFERALAPPGLLSFVPFDTVAVQATMLSLSSLERHDAFNGLADAVLAAAGRRGALLAFLVVSTFRSMSMLRLGDLGGAEAEARQALRSATEQGWERGAAGLAAIRAAALIDLGDLPGAADALADAELMHVAPGFPSALLLSARGRLAAERGKLADGIAALLECGQTLLSMRIHSPGVLPWRSDAAVLLTVAGDNERARDLALEEVELARRLAGPVAVARALHGLARATRGDERIALLHEANDLVAVSPAGLTRAMVAVELGATLRRQRRPTEARAFLNDGLDAAARCRCVPLAGRARDELAVLGVAPRRTIAFGPSALTPSEVRVARLAAEGRTNNEIAQHLFVTRKTVEKHLASAYRKLGIDSRSQLDSADLEQAEPTR